MEELIEAIRDGTYVQVNYTKKDQPSNRPHEMKRHREEIVFHHPFHKNSTRNYTLSEMLDTSEITDAKQLKALLDMLNMKKIDEKPKPHVHVHRNSTIGKGETKNFKFPAKIFNVSDNSANSEEIMQEVVQRLKQLGEKGESILEKINEQFQGKTDDINSVISIKGRHYSKPAVKYDDNIDRARRRKRELILGTAIAKSLNEHDEENDMAIEEVSISI